MHPDPKPGARARAKQAAKAAVDAAASRTADALRRVDANREKIADHLDTAAQVTGLAAGVATVGAMVAAPTGLAAVGVAVGIISAPLIVTAAPILGGVAMGTATVSAIAVLYTKAKRRRNRDGAR